MTKCRWESGLTSSQLPMADDFNRRGCDGFAQFAEFTAAARVARRNSRG